MALPGVTISLANGNLGGLIATEDGTLGLVFTGATEGSVTVATPFSVTSLQDLEALGVTSLSTLNELLYRHVKEFYGELQGTGTLYLMVVADTVLISDAANAATAGGVVKLLDYAKGEIRVVGLCITPQASPTVTNGLNALTYTAATNLQATLNTYATAQKPLRGIIAADSFSGLSGDLTNMRASTLNRVGIAIGDTVNTNTGAALGLLFGRLARIPVQRKISRVKDGALSVATAFIGAVSADNYSSTGQIHDKGFITIRTHIGRNGLFYTSDPTCAPATDDYSMIARGRVIDKAQRIAYATYINEVDDEVPIEPDGKIDAAWAKYLEQIVTDQITGSMVAAGEISAVKCYVDPNQNVLASNKVIVKLGVLPVGYASFIEVQLGFVSTI